MSDVISNSDQNECGGIPTSVRQGVPTFWKNPRYRTDEGSASGLPFSFSEVEDAERRWRRFDPLLAILFRELETGRIDSPLLPLGTACRRRIIGDDGAVLVKADHALPVTGCIKARGGVYEVLVYAESVARKAGLIEGTESYSRLSEPKARALFARHSIGVGSTGNLGFSVGVMARALGFGVEVHMSRDAKEWKKKRLRDIGARVVEHEGDYGSAVSAARTSFLGRDGSHFVDDETSRDLFLGYATAAFDLQRQLTAMGIPVDESHPLYVYLPCGVGGAPGGVTFGLKSLFGASVHPILAEPVASPCLLVQLAAGLDRSISVYDVGLDNRTAADGLAVARASMLVARTIREQVKAVATVPDVDLFRWAGILWSDSGLRLEPSAAAGFAAAERVCKTFPGIQKNTGSTHVIWTTGGSLLPEDEFQQVLSYAHRLVPGNP